MAKLMTIGAFARLAGLTVKTLRFYADEGLLPPSGIDPKSRYRLYAPEQLERLGWILSLREAGFAISEIRTLASGEVESTRLNEALQARRRSLIAERSLIELQIAAVEAFTRRVEEAPRLRVKIIEPVLVHSIRSVTPTLERGVAGMFERAEEAAAEANARARGSPFLLVHQDCREGGVDVEACIPIESGQESRISSRIVGGSGLACSMFYAGPYSQTEAVRASLEQRMARAALARRGPWREIYHRFGADQKGYKLPNEVLAAHPARYLTEILCEFTLDNRGE